MIKLNASMEDKIMSETPDYIGDRPKQPRPQNPKYSPAAKAAALAKRAKRAKAAKRAAAKQKRKGKQAKRKASRSPGGFAEGGAIKVETWYDQVKRKYGG